LCRVVELFVVSSCDSSHQAAPNRQPRPQSPRPDAIDPALRRPGRFDREVFFGLPSAADRESILSALTRAWAPPPDAALLRRVAAATEGFAGADLQALCASAVLTAARRVAPGALGAAAREREARERALLAAAAATPAGVVPLALAAESLISQQQAVQDEEDEEEEQQQHEGEDVEMTEQVEPSEAATMPPATTSLATDASRRHQQHHATPFPASLAQFSDAPTTSTVARPAFLGALSDCIAELMAPASPTGERQFDSPAMPPDAEAAAGQAEAGGVDDEAAAAAAEADAAEAAEATEQEEEDEEEEAGEHQQQENVEEEAGEGPERQEREFTTPPQSVQPPRLPALVSPFALAQPPAPAPPPPPPAWVTSLQVLPRDWWSALAAAPPPCSKREAAAAVAAESGGALPHRLAPLLLPSLRRALAVLLSSGALGGDGPAVATAMSAGAGGDAAGLENLLCEAPSDNRQTADGTSSGSNAAAAPSGLGALGSFEGSGGAGAASHVPCHLLLAGPGAAGQDQAARALLALLRRGGAAVHSLALPGLLLRGQGEVAAGVAAVVAEAVGQAGRGQALVLYLPRLEMWAGGRWGGGQDAGSDSEDEGAAAAASPSWSLFEQLLRQVPRRQRLVVLATSHATPALLPAAVAAVFGGGGAAAGAPGPFLLSPAAQQPQQQETGSKAIIECPASVPRADLTAALQRAGRDAAGAFGQWLGEGAPTADLDAPAAADDPNSGADDEPAEAGEEAPWQRPAAAAALAPAATLDGPLPGLDGAQADEARRLFGAVQRALASLGDSLRKDPRAAVAHVSRRAAAGDRRRGGRQGKRRASAAGRGVSTFKSMQALGGAAGVGWFSGLDEFRAALGDTAELIR
jgi:SpoVK/Ycf46/Vps4 family AAA+-type ATPase